MKKKLLPPVMALLIAFVLVPALAAYANEISVTVEGQQVPFADQAPVLVDGRTLVPVRGVFEELGFTVDWNGDAQEATLTSSDYTVVLTVGSATFTTNGVSYSLDVPAQIIGGRTMLPIRAVLESVGYNVGWNSGTSTVLISTEPLPETAAPAETTDNLERIYLNVFSVVERFNALMATDEFIWAREEEVNVNFDEEQNILEIRNVRIGGVFSFTVEADGRLVGGGACVESGEFIASDGFRDGASGEFFIERDFFAQNFDWGTGAFHYSNLFYGIFPMMHFEERAYVLGVGRTAAGEIVENVIYQE